MIKTRRSRSNSSSNDMDEKDNTGQNIGLIELNGMIYPQTTGKPTKLVPGNVYTIRKVQTKSSNHWDSNYRVFLEEACDLNLPEKIINSKKDTEFINRVLTSHKLSNRITTGVMLFGLKGSGKTVMAKQLAVMSELPIVIMDTSVNFNDVSNFFKLIGGNICLLCDEWDKRDDNGGMLTLMDGLEAEFKKLLIMTANSIQAMDRNLLNRPSRIRYFRRYEQVSKFFTTTIVKNENIDDKYGVLTKFIDNNFDVESLDIIKTFIEEVKIFAKGKIDERELYNIAKEMNIELKGQHKFREVYDRNQTVNNHMDNLIGILEGFNLSEKEERVLQRNVNELRDNLKDFNIINEFIEEDDNPYGEYEEDDEYDDCD